MKIKVINKAKEYYSYQLTTMCESGASDNHSGVENTTNNGVNILLKLDPSTEITTLNGGSMSFCKVFTVSSYVPIGLLVDIGNCQCYLAGSQFRDSYSEEIIINNFVVTLRTIITTTYDDDSTAEEKCNLQLKVPLGVQVILKKGTKLQLKENFANLTLEKDQAAKIVKHSVC